MQKIIDCKWGIKDQSRGSVDQIPHKDSHYFQSYANKSLAENITAAGDVFVTG